MCSGKQIESKYYVKPPPIKEYPNVLVDEAYNGKDADGILNYQLQTQIYYYYLTLANKLLNSLHKLEIVCTVIISDNNTVISTIIFNALI